MRSKRQWIVVAGLSALLGGLALWGGARGMPGTRLELRPSEVAAEESAGVYPKAVVDKAEHQFGFLDPADRCEHVFMIRNEGAAPLELTRGTTSCKCTMSDIPEMPIPPGGEVGVRVASKIVQKEGAFSHSAIVFTNDPQNSTIRLRIEGEVRKYIGANPSRIVVADIKRNETCAAEVTVYSQVWKDFEIRDIQASLAGLNWELLGPADPAALRKLGARSGQRLRVTVPAETAVRDFWERLELTAAPAAGAEPRRLVVDISGSVLARVELTGAKLDALNRVVRLGALRKGEGAVERLALVVRDDHRDVKIHQIETHPSFLQVQMTPHERSGGAARLYLIELEIPADAPACNYLTEKANVRIITDHPVAPTIEFGVAFAVASRQ